MGFFDDVKGAGERIILNSFYDVSGRLSSEQKSNYYRVAGVSEKNEVKYKHKKNVSVK